MDVQKVLSEAAAFVAPAGRKCAWQIISPSSSALMWMR